MTKTERGLNKVTVELSDQALADLHAVQLKLRAKWQDAPGLESYEVTEADAVRTALAMCVDDGDRSVADLMPEGRTLNRNQQRLVQKTDEPGTDHSAHVWVWSVSVRLTNTLEFAATNTEQTGQTFTCGNALSAREANQGFRNLARSEKGELRHRLDLCPVPPKGRKGRSGQ